MRIPVNSIGLHGGPPLSPKHDNPSFISYTYRPKALRKYIRERRADSKRLIFSHPAGSPAQTTPSNPIARNAEKNPGIFRVPWPNGTQLCPRPRQANVGSRSFTWTYATRLE